MPNQTDSPDGKPHTSPDSPHPDVEGKATDGQSNPRGQGASDEQGREGRDSGRVDHAPGAGLSDHNGPSNPDPRDDAMRR